MPRVARRIVAGALYHVVNRGNDRAPLFRDPSEYDRFERLVAAGRAEVDVRLYAYCLMPNHWHLVLRPVRAADLARFVGRFAQKHAQYLRVRDGTVGEGHVYQGRFHVVPVVGDEQFLTVCRYVERNPVEAGLVGRAEHWRWSSLTRRLRRSGDGLIDPWPVPVPTDWLACVNGRAWR